MTDHAFPSRPVPGGSWHSTTLRIVTVYAVIFSVSLMLLLVLVERSVTFVMNRETDAVLHWQLIYFDTTSVDRLADAVRRRSEHERMHPNFYGLFSSDGQHLAGDILVRPPGVTVDRVGITLEDKLVLGGNETAPVVRIMAAQRANGDTLVIARDLTHVLRIRAATITALIGGGLLCLSAGVIAGLALSVRQLRRLKAIRRVTQCIAQRGDLTQRLPTEGHDEIGMLAQLVNHMLAEVERLMNEVKGTCDGIAHDLRTPLGHIRTSLLHIDERIAEPPDRELKKLVNDARRDTDALLERFRAMLRISEIGSLQRRGGFEEMQLAPLLTEVGELFEPLAESRSIRLLTQIASVGTTHADRALIFEALTNLLDNAVKFTPDGGTVMLKLTRTPRGPQIDITDSGPGIPVDERKAVLQRFYRSDRTRHLPGSGLGLSIVSAVVNVHDYSMQISDGNPGTRVTIQCWTKTLI
ncbi:sensor histidine kinase [Paraburkholderia dilworthii]|uniref:sensor histidine kinase n=1 Tax=Paraburkholderia dilworthii TaxID=948106 RepID=UPI003898DBED